MNHTRIRQRGRFQIALPPAQAFKLFTAEGERLWVPDWAPEILGPLPQEAGLVFLTGIGTQRTIWTVIESRPADGRVRYSRVTPGSRAGIVSVDVTGADGGSKVVVSYDLTALSADGEAALEAYSPANFAGMMDEWRTMIERMLAASRPDLATLVV